MKVEFFMQGQLKWDHRMTDLAGVFAGWSKDPSTKVGAVIFRPGANIVVAAGFNGPPRGVDDQGKHPGEALDGSRWYRPQKYLWVEHAERNAIYNAARDGLSTNGCWMFLNYTPHVCADCARAIIQAGIVRVIGGPAPFPGKGAQWAEHDIVAETMLREAGVEVVTL
jgi:dCMP deaminase